MVLIGACLLQLKASPFRAGMHAVAPGVRVKIIGWDRMYDQYESKEAGLSIEVERLFFGSLRGSPG
jgi:hypothetical protein